MYSGSVPRNCPIDDINSEILQFRYKKLILNVLLQHFLITLNNGTYSMISQKMISRKKNFCGGELQSISYIFFSFATFKPCYSANNKRLLYTFWQAHLELSGAKKKFLWVTKKIYYILSAAIYKNISQSNKLLFSIH